MNDKLKKFKKTLHSYNYKLTPQREIILSVLLDNEHNHVNAEDIYLLTREISPEISLATVYRTLELFSQLKIIQKLHFGDSVTRYEISAEEDTHHHHHLICLKCGRVEEINEDWLGFMEEKVEKEYGFEIIDHRLIFQGSNFDVCVFGQCSKYINFL